MQHRSSDDVRCWNQMKWKRSRRRRQRGAVVAEFNSSGGAQEEEAARAARVRARVDVCVQICDATLSALLCLYCEPRHSIANKSRIGWTRALAYRLWVKYGHRLFCRLQAIYLVKSQLNFLNKSFMTARIMPLEEATVQINKIDHKLAANAAARHQPI